MVLAGVVAFAGWFVRQPDDGYYRDGGRRSGAVEAAVQEYFWAWSLIPGLVMGVLEISRRAIDDVEKELAGLGGMRYDYKGA